jgi:ABC-type transport system substrate-binding protein
MSGSITLKVRKGRSLDPRYKYYPEWYLEVKDEGSKKTCIVSPSYTKVETILIDILVHELRVDKTRNRRPDFVKWRKWLKDLSTDKLIEKAQTEVDMYNIPEIYYECLERR